MANHRTLCPGSSYFRQGQSQWLDFLAVVYCVSIVYSVAEVETKPRQTLDNPIAIIEPPSSALTMNTATVGVSEQSQQPHGAMCTHYLALVLTRLSFDSDWARLAISRRNGIEEARQARGQE